MGDEPLERTQALRLLFEKWGVPLNVIEVASSERLVALEERAAREEWQAKDSKVCASEAAGDEVNEGPAGLHRQVEQVFRADLERFSAMPDDSPDIEKRARALSIMAKTLESIVSTQERLVEATVRQDGNGGRDGTGEIPDPARSAELDRELARLVEGLA